ncbi:MAG: PAS domain S-box protein [Gemmataceae bacterium]
MSRLASIPMASFLVGHDGRVLDANQKALDLFGYAAAELLGQPVEVLLPASVRERHVELRTRYVQEPEPRLLLGGRELFARHKDGTPIPVAVGLHPLQGASPAQILVHVFDLSDVKRAERHLRHFFEISIDLLCIGTTDGYFRRVNQSFTRVLGHSQEALLSRPFLEFVHPEDQESTLFEVEKLAAGAPTVRYRNRYRDTNGQYHWLEWNAASIPADGLIFAVARDITEQIVMEQMLRAREERERAILDNTSAIIFVKNTRGQYEFINQTFSGRFGIAREDVLGKTDADLFSGPVAELLRRNDSQVLDTGRPLQVEEMIPIEDVPRTYISVKVPLRDPRGQVNAVAGICTDITDQLQAKRVDEEMKLAQLVQQRLYPRTFPRLDGYDIAGASLPMTRLCGDYYDYLLLDDGRLLLAIGDVSGHGLGPALTMVEIRALLRVLLPRAEDLPAVLTQVNRQLLQDSPEAFITLFLVDLNLKARALRYLGAGHDAWLLRADGRAERLASTSMPLGIADIGFDLGAPGGALGPGDLLLMFTDGLTESASPGGALFGSERMLATVAAARHEPAEAIVGRLFSHIREHTAGLPLQDDITLIVAKAL